MNRKFENFDLEFSRSADGYIARVLTSPGGEGSQAFTIPINTLELENVVLHVLAARSVRSISSTPGTRLREVGGALFKSVFAGEVLQCYLSSLGKSTGGDTGLRMRLRFVDTPELVNLPWELLYDERVAQWVALKLDTPVVRYLRSPTQLEPLRVSGPLHVLTVVSNPSDVPELDVESEAAAVEAALQSLDKTAPGSVVTDTLRHPTHESLQQKLMGLPWNVLHFIGHGDFDERANTGVLVLEDERGKARPITANRLSVILQGRSVKLVILNSCQGSRSGEDNHSGVAQSLIAQGIPAVIAMQFPITDTAALAFSRMFYHALVLGSSLENAVVEARRAIYQKSELEWATPTLYLRAENGHLFDRPEPPAAIAKVPDIVNLPARSDVTDLEANIDPLRTTAVDESSGETTPISELHEDTTRDIVLKREDEKKAVATWQPYAIVAALLAVLVVTFAVATHSSGPSPDVSPSAIAEVTVAPAAATAEPTAIPVATSAPGSLATLSPHLHEALFGTLPFSSLFPQSTCPMRGASVSDTFESATHEWGLLPASASFDHGYLVVRPAKGISQRIVHRGSIGDATICTMLAVARTDPAQRATDDSAAGLSFWETSSRYYTFFITSRGNVRVAYYDFNAHGWTNVFRAKYAVKRILGTQNVVLSAVLAKGNATFYVDGANVGTATGGPAGSTEAGVIAESGKAEPESLKWYFGDYGVAAAK